MKIKSLLSADLIQYVVVTNVPAAKLVLDNRRKSEQNNDKNLSASALTSDVTSNQTTYPYYH